MKKCFVVSPIGSEGSDTRRRSDELLKYIIEPVCKICDFEAIRVDNIHASDSINQTILDSLKTADLVIADLTDHNPNAFYELGYRFALNKPLIQLKHKDDTIPFDVAGIRTLDYDLSSLPATETLKEKLEKTIKSFDYESSNENNTENNHNNVTLNSKILQELFAIQDSIKLLQSDLASIKTTDTATVSVLVDKLTANAKKSTDEVMTETLLKAFLNDPDKISNFMVLAEKFNTLSLK